MDADTTHHLFEALVNGATAINVSVEDLAALDLIALDAARWHVRHGQTGYRVEVVKADYSARSFILRIGHKEVAVVLTDVVQRQVESMGFERNSGKHVNEITAPMPGLVLDVRVKPGDHVETNEPLVILEAMKMENVLSAPRDGVIADVAVSQGSTVEKAQVLVRFAS
ncbi:MAG: biotin/lipoyl-containing protein [Saprospiraceae bacterium]|nr:biotin/lipoyl-containing protein [Saprospiraceae bacterium]